jgi:uncharacterized protein (DUF1015 family)
MVDILPFRGIRYSLREIEKVVTPPYDVITPEEKEKYYGMHKNNIIRVILGREHKGDNERENKYTRARRYFDAWLKEGILRRDEEPSIYVYYQDYLHGGERKLQRGFIALCKLEEFEKKVILPHEETLKEAIEDRLELLRACKANFSQVYMLYSDKGRRVEDVLENSIKGRAPLIDINVDGVRHRVWKVSSPSTIEQVRVLMEDKKTFIADGHHRYITALKFRDEMRKSGKNYDYRTAYFVNMDGGVTILPAHRVVKGLRNFRLKKFLVELKKNFEVENTGRQEMFKKMKGQKHSYGLYCAGKYYYLRLKNESLMDELFGSRRSEPWKNLDITILRYGILEGILGLHDKENIIYEVEEEKVVNYVNSGRYQLALFVNPTTVEEVRDVALHGETMPGKATYFYPKPLTGLIIYQLD